METTNTIDARLRLLIDELLGERIPLSIAKKDFEKKYIDVALLHSGGHQGRAAQLLGIHRNTIGRKLRFMR